MSTPALQAAAEELVQLALSESSYGVTHSATLDELRHIHSLNKKLVDSNDGIAKQLGEVVTELKANRRASELGTLQWAITNASIGSFFYINSGMTGNGRPVTKISSEQVVTNVLLTFMKGVGVFLGDGKIRDSKDQRHERWSSLTEAGKNNLELSEISAFHKALKEQIFELTGSNPRIAEHDGKFAIYQK